MIPTFVIICAAMALAALVAVLYPLVRPAPAPVQKGEPVLAKATAAGFVLAVALPIAAGVLYGKLTSFPWNDPMAAQPAPAGHGEGGAAGTMEQAVQMLEAKLQQNPGDAEGWQMLGRTYLMMGDANKAVAAYDKSASLRGAADPKLNLDIAEALVLADNPATLPRAKALIESALQADPASQKALWYQGVMAARAGDKETAKRNWTQLLDQNPPAEIREVIVQQLAEIGVTVPGAAPAMASAPAAGMGGGGMGGGMGMAAADGTAPAKGRTIRVNVSLDPSLAAKVQAGQPMFVSARQPGIPGPPLAAVRVTTDQLGSTVVLSDANSMIEGRNLSSVDDVEIVARVAFGGTPMTQSGDLIGTAVQKKGGGEDLDVVIAKVQP